MMGLLELASGASLWRGYEYYKANRVLAWRAVSESAYEGTVQGSGDSRYTVAIDLAHPRKSRCDCPHADGRQLICKHKIALYFTVFPAEAEKYYEAVVAYEEEEERRQEELDDKIEAYINGCTKAELRQIIYELLYNCGDRALEYFIYEHIDI